MNDLISRQAAIVRAVTVLLIIALTVIYMRC